METKIYSKRNILLVILVTFILGYLLGTITTCNFRKTENQFADAIVTDTVYKSITEYIPIKPYPKLELPKRIILYGISNREVDSVSINVNDSLFGIQWDKRKLQLDFLDTQTKNVKTKIYSIDTDKFKYSFTNGNLTYQKLRFYEKKDFLKPYVYLQYRPFNNLFDIGGGINFKTGNFNYQMGVNSFYYPKIKSKGFDLEIRVQYNF